MKKTKKRQKPEYKALEADVIRTLNIDMNIDAYVQETNYRAKVMRSLYSFDVDDDRYMETQYNIIIFCYCSNNSVYAITTKTAWVVQNNRDPEFPQRIANRLLTLDGPKDRSNKPLFSDISKVTERRKLGSNNTMDALDDPYIRLNYTARLRKNASIYNLDCFDIRKQKSPVNVLINYGSIRFQCSIKINSLADLIEHLHKIDKKLPTCTTKNEDGNDENEEDSVVYKQCLRTPDFQIKSTLNVHLMENLKKSIHDKMLPV